MGGISDAPRPLAFRRAVVLSYDLNKEAPVSIRSSALLLWGLLCVGCATATGSHGPGSASAVKVDPERLVSDRGAGPVLVGQKIGDDLLGGF